MKKLTAILITFLLTLGICFSFGCSKPVEKITDIKRFKGMTEQTDRIDVEYDIYTGKPFNFSITDKTEIDQIMQIILNTPVKYTGEEPAVGSNSFLTIVQGEKKYTLKLGNFSGDKGYYVFTSAQELYTKINELAELAGAFDN